MVVIAVGADHAGFPLKEDLKAWLIARGYQVLDFGTHSTDSVDYPDYAAAVGHAVRARTAERGVLVCGTGIGMAMVANKVPGIRAAVCADVAVARLSREHNDANVLALGGRTAARDLAVDILETWLGTTFLGGRHACRIEKIRGVERAFGGKETVHAQAR